VVVALGMTLNRLDPCRDKPTAREPSRWGRPYAHMARLCNFRSFGHPRSNVIDMVPLVR
jgi:hypothetical protein